MLIIPKPDIAASEITPREVYQGRRRFLGQAGSLALAGTSLGMLADHVQAAPASRQKIPGTIKTPYGAEEKLTP